MKRIPILLLIAALSLATVACSGIKVEKNTSASTDGATTAPASTAAPSTKEPDPFDSLSDDDPVSGSLYVYDDYSPYLTIGDFTGVDKILHADAEKMKDDYLAKVLESFCGVNFTPAEDGEALAKGDQAVIFYTGHPVDASLKLDEDTLQGMTNADSESGHPLVIGSNSFITEYKSEEHPEKNNPGFEEQLIGAKAGESRTIKVTFPDGYSEVLGGVEVYFDVRIVSFGHPDDPTELTDEMVSEHTSEEYKTVADLSDYLLSQYKAELAVNAAREKVTVISYPEKELKDFIDSYIEYYTTEDMTDAEKKELAESAEKQAKESIGDQIVSNYLYSRYEIVLTKKQYNDYLKENYETYAMLYMYYYGITSIDQMEDYFGRDYLISECKSMKLTDYFLEHASWTDAASEPSTPADTTPES